MRVYTDEFRADALRLIHRGDRNFMELSAALGVSHWTLRDWYKKDEMAKKAPKKNRPAAVAAADETREEKAARLERVVKKLEQENASLRQDREILKKAAAFFAKESE